jgi:hypothetical protein
MSILGYISVMFYYSPEFKSMDYIPKQNLTFSAMIFEYIQKDLSESKVYFPLPITKKWFSLFVYFLGSLFLCSYIQVIMQEIYFRVTLILYPELTILTKGFYFKTLQWNDRDVIPMCVRVYVYCLLFDFSLRVP